LAIIDKELGHIRSEQAILAAANTSKWKRKRKETTLIGN
jgi:hypothetical protein